MKWGRRWKRSLCRWWRYGCQERTAKKQFKKVAQNWKSASGNEKVWERFTNCGVGCLRQRMRRVSGQREGADTRRYGGGMKNCVQKWRRKLGLMSREEIGEMSKSSTIIVHSTTWVAGNECSVKRKWVKRWRRSLCREGRHGCPEMYS
jgi:hypothetical protein